MSADQTHDERALRVRLAADPASVPGARRFVADGLRAWGHDSLVNDASLCVSELAGNAALHGASTYIEICVLDLDQAVRLWVEDDGPAPVAAIALRISLDDLDELQNELADLPLDAPATGRGLAIVSVLASDWGVEELENGKRVWADLSAGDALDGDTMTPHDSSTDVPRSAELAKHLEAILRAPAHARAAGRRPSADPGLPT